MKIHCTKDYDKFNMFSYNRPIDIKHVNALKASFKAHPDLFLHPIVVNPEFEIVDGQHRFEAAKQLGLEIWYVIDESYVPEKLQVINNVQIEWSQQDYVNYWAHQGKEDYQKINQFCKENNVCLSIALIWCSHVQSGRTGNKIRRGTFTMRMNPQTIESFAVYRKFIRILDEMRPDLKPFNLSTSFAKMCRTVLTHSLVDKQRLLEAFQKKNDMITGRKTTDCLINELIQIYNHRQKNKLAVYHDGRGYNLVRVEASNEEDTLF